MNDALPEQPEVSLLKRSCSPSPAQHVGRTEISRLQIGDLSAPVQAGAPTVAASRVDVGATAPDVDAGPSRARAELAK
eukprot:8387004-Alexandrium_andersonii.AAC.1